MTTVQQVLDLARAYVVESDRRYYSRAQYALSKLADAVRQLPSWIAAPPIEPAAAVERELACGSMYSISNDDGNLILVIRDHDGEVLAPVLSQEEATQLLADVRRVIAAMETK